MCTAFVRIYPFFIFLNSKTKQTKKTKISVNKDRDNILLGGKAFTKEAYDTSDGK